MSDAVGRYCAGQAETEAWLEKLLMHKSGANSEDVCGQGFYKVS